MSLLLDALKKAAEDKKKASNNEETSVDVKADVVEKNNTNSGATKLGVEEELSLDVEPDLTTVGGSNHIVAEVDKKTTSQSGASINEARHTVSDDALSLLIYKTNSEEKKRKRIIAAGTTMTVLLAISLGGLYYYSNLQNGINSLELKHRTSLKRMEAKTSKQRTPEKTEIIDNLTANSDIKIEQKPRLVELEKVEVKPLLKKKIKSSVKNKLAKNKDRTLLIEKTKQADLVGEKLEAAFSAYEAGRYTDGKNIYKEVVLLEKNNRDALLGLGAIAVIEKEKTLAKKYYETLLKLDPNDSLAVSALSNLRSKETSPQNNEKYLIAMLEKTPESAQLNFELGNVYARQSNWTAAQKSYFKAWQKESENPDYIFNLAVSLDQLGQQKQAMDFYKNSLKKAKNKQVGFSREVVEQRVAELSGL